MSTVLDAMDSKYNLALVFALLLVAAPFLAHAKAGTLTCTDNPSSKVTFLCSGDGTLAVGANLTYTVSVDETSSVNQLYDLNVTLKSPSGDSDL